jgi:hypothetical protein
VSRQFVPMTRIRIEGLLAAFPKLVGTGKQHTYVETENVRYVYQPLEQGTMFLLLVTNKQSNILEDLDILRLLSKVLPEYTQQQTDEEGISRHAFDLIFAFDEVISLGHKENVTMSQVKTFTEMESHEEKLHKMIIQSKINDTKDVMKRKAMEIDKFKIDRHGGGRGGGGMGMGGGGMGGVGVSGGFESGRGDGFDDGFDARGGAGGYGGSSGDFGNSRGGSSARDGVARPAGPSKGLVLGGKGKQNKFLESLRAEGEAVELEPSANARAAASAGPGAPSVPREGVSLQIEEKITCSLKKDGGLESMELQGTMMLEIKGGEEDAFIRVAVATGANEGFQFKTHPNIDKALHAAEGVLGLKDPARPFPMGSPLGILKWRYQTRDESVVPLSINCWPSVSGGESFVSIEYEATDAFDLHNVVISIPLPPLRDPPRGEPGGRRLHLRQPEARAELGGADDRQEQPERLHGVCGARDGRGQLLPHRRRLLLQRHALRRQGGRGDAHHRRRRRQVFRRVQARVRRVQRRVTRARKGSSPRVFDNTPSQR